jgi:hypothetical protein
MLLLSLFHHCRRPKVSKISRLTCSTIALPDFLLRLCQVLAAAAGIDVGGGGSGVVGQDGQKSEIAGAGATDHLL